MANQKDLKIVISAVDNASKEIEKVNSTISEVATYAKRAAIAIGAAAGGFGYVLKQTTDASNELNNALIGLNSVARAFKQDTDKAKQAAIDLASDGLLSVKSAADSLKNLLATGFSLPEAINLMKGFKDAAAFNRQGTLEFGQAIEGATQGIKNQNSILVDNAGITKNLSLILKEAGYSVQDLSNVTSDAGVRQALYNGILKEASIFQGDAARAAETLSGQQAALSTQIFTLKAAIGDQLAPVMLSFVKVTSDVTSQVSAFVETVKNAGGIVAYLNEKITEILTYINNKTGIITIFKKAWDDIVLVFRESLLPELTKLWASLQPLMPFLQVLAEIIGIILYGAIIALVKIIEASLIVTIKSLTGFVRIINEQVQIFKDGWDSVTTTISKVIGWIDQLIEKISKLNVVSGAVNAVSSLLGFGGARASGGPVSSGSAYLVGEQGPELFVPGASGSIIPNNRLSGSQVNITITGNTLLDQRAAEKIGNMIVGRLALNTKI